jgi:hypothetical protein
VGQNPMEIADRLISVIRESGDLRVAAPNLSATFVFLNQILEFISKTIIINWIVVTWM